MPKRIWLAVVLALAVRIACLYFSRTAPFYEPVILDPKYYQDWALRILAGDWKGEGGFYGLPLYPFFLALCYKFSNHSLLAVKLTQSLL